jgi:hypothetical protein
MCREEPLHSNPEIVSGKIWLIGRAYAAAVERMAPFVRKARPADAASTPKEAER